MIGLLLQYNQVFTFMTGFRDVITYLKLKFARDKQNSIASSVWKEGDL